MPLANLERYFLNVWLCAHRTHITILDMLVWLSSQISTKISISPNYHSLLHFLVEILHGRGFLKAALVLTKVTDHRAHTQNTHTHKNTQRTHTYTHTHTLSHSFTHSLPNTQSTHNHKVHINTKCTHTQNTNTHTHTQSTHTQTHTVHTQSTYTKYT